MGLICIVDNFVQPRLVHPSCFVVLTTSRLNLAVSSNKRFRTRAVVPNASGITDLIAGSSIQTWIASAAAIDASLASKTGLDAVVPLDKKVKSIKLCFPTNSYTKLPPSQNFFRCMVSFNFSQVYIVSFFIITLIDFALLSCILPFSRTKGSRVLEKWRM